MIRTCYESDINFIEKYHELSGQSLDVCINRTIYDLKNVNVYGIFKESQLIGYFGDSNLWLTGFFIIPKYRNLKKNVWNMINNHFNGSFNIGILSKNKPFIKFLKQNDCKFSHYEPSIDGLGEIYIKENN